MSDFALVRASEERRILTIAVLSVTVHTGEQSIRMGMYEV